MLKSKRTSVGRSAKLKHMSMAHIGLDRTRPIFPNVPAPAVAYVFGAVHRARHTRLSEHTVAAHTAIKKHRLDIALDTADWPFDPGVTEPLPQRVQGHHQAFKMIVKPLEQARIANRPLSDRVHDNQLRKKFWVKDRCSM